MARIAINHPGNSLAVWLAGHHPELFLAALKQAKAAKVAKQARLHGLIGLADGDTTTFDSSSDVTASFDPNSTSAAYISDSTPSGASFISSLSDTPTSSGSTLGSELASAGTSVWDAVGSLGGYITSAPGLTNLTNLAKTYFGAQAVSAQVQAQQQVLQTQIARATVGQTAAPITYSGGLPVYATTTQQGAVYQPLTSQGVASLAPSSVRVFLSQYGLYVGVAALVLVGVVAMKRSKHANK